MFPVTHILHWKSWHLRQKYEKYDTTWEAKDDWT